MIDNCSRLNPYSVIVRYPNELAVDETITENSIAMAQKYMNFAIQKYKIDIC
jgi:hypothetical protein